MPCRYIQFALILYTKSKGFYDTLREFGYFALPSGRLLCSYLQNGTSTPGWRLEEAKRLHELYMNSTGLSSDLRYGGLFFDAMKISEGLVYSTSTNKLVGFTDIGSAALEAAFSDVLDPEADLHGACNNT